MSASDLPRRLLAEFLGSALLAAIVIGSGLAAQQLSPGDTGLQLLENAAATATGLFAIILMFGPISGAHLNPVVSLVDAALVVTLRNLAAHGPPTESRRASEYIVMSEAIMYALSRSKAARQLEGVAFDVSVGKSRRDTTGDKHW